MQPYFLPYPGYFALIARSDRWVVFDDAKMMRHGWVDRNRMLHPTEGWAYIKVSTAKHSRGTPICDVVASSSQDWQGKMLRQLDHYRKAPHFAAVRAWLQAALAAAPAPLHQLNTHMLAQVCAFIGLPFDPVMHSSLDYYRSRVSGPGDWAVVVAGALGATTYLNPPGGLDLFDPAAFAAEGCALRFLRWTPQPYPQIRPGFEAGLSILDLMMMVEPADIRAQLATGALLTAAGLRDINARESL